MWPKKSEKKTKQNNKPLENEVRSEYSYYLQPDGTREVNSPA